MVSGIFAKNPQQSFVFTNYDTRLVNRAQEGGDIKIVLNGNGSNVQEGMFNIFEKMNMKMFLEYISTFDRQQGLTMEDVDRAVSLYKNLKYSKWLGFLKDVRYDRNAGVASFVTSDKTYRLEMKQSVPKKMPTNLKPGNDAYNIIKSYEDLKLKSYKCPAGVWTIGYGHTKGVKPGQTITEEKANAFLKQDVQDAVNIVRKYVKVPLTQYQFDSLVSFVFNIGEGNFKDSTLLKRLNAGQNLEAANQILVWNKAGGKVQGGLVKRRNDEYKLFMNKIA